MPKSCASAAVRGNTAGIPSPETEVTCAGIPCSGWDVTSSINILFVIDDIVLCLGMSHLFRNETHGLSVLSRVEHNQCRAADSFPNLKRYSDCKLSKVILHGVWGFASK